MIRREQGTMALNSNVDKFIHIAQSSSQMLSFETGTNYHHQWCSIIRLHRLRTILTSISSTSMFTRSVSESRWPRNNIKKLSLSFRTYHLVWASGPVRSAYLCNSMQFFKLELLSQNSLMKCVKKTPQVYDVLRILMYKSRKTRNLPAMQRQHFSH